MSEPVEKIKLLAQFEDLRAMGYSEEDARELLEGRAEGVVFPIPASGATEALLEVGYTDRQVPVLQRILLRRLADESAVDVQELAVTSTMWRTADLPRPPATPSEPATVSISQRVATEGVPAPASAASTLGWLGLGCGAGVVVVALFLVFFGERDSQVEPETIAPTTTAVGEDADATTNQDLVVEIGDPVACVDGADVDDPGMTITDVVASKRRDGQFRVGITMAASPAEQFSSRPFYSVSVKVPQTEVVEADSGRALDDLEAPARDGQHLFGENRDGGRSQGIVGIDGEVELDPPGFIFNVTRDEFVLTTDGLAVGPGDQLVVVLTSTVDENHPGPQPQHCAEAVATFAT